MTIALERYDHDTQHRTPPKVTLPLLYRFFFPTISASAIRMAAARLACSTRVIPLSTSFSSRANSPSCLCVSASIFWISCTSYCVTSESDQPPLPARAVRPTR